MLRYPPGTPSRNRIQHRLFSFITTNWRGQPLTAYRVVIELMANTAPAKASRSQAALDQASYPTGRKVTDKQLTAVPLTKHDWHPEWKYTVQPSSLKQVPSGA